MNHDNEYFYNYLVKMLDISKIGLTFSTDPYAIDNYKEIQNITMEVLSKFMNINFDRPNFFKRDIYPTPNVSCRAIIINDKNEVLMVQEKKDNGYSLPGGWCDLYDTPKEAVIREAEEEAGVKIEVVRLVGILSRKPFDSSIGVPEYALFFECKVIENFHKHDHEILDVKYFDINSIPKISNKITKNELIKTVNAVINGTNICD